jgi:acyl-CoA synthetase (AMP-forming)/AMP-acid ligase II
LGSAAQPFTHVSPHAITVPNMPYADYILEHSASRGSQPALIDAASGRSFTHASLGGRVDAAAAALAAAGVRAGDVVNLHLPNCIEYFIAFAAVTRLGAVNTTSNPLYTADEVRGPVGAAAPACGAALRGGSARRHRAAPACPRARSSRTSTATRRCAGW